MCVVCACLSAFASFLSVRLSLWVPRDCLPPASVDSTVLGPEGLRLALRGPLPQLCDQLLCSQGASQVLWAAQLLFLSVSFGTSLLASAQCPHAQEVRGS